MYGISSVTSFDAPLDALGACHARIETQLAALERLPAHLGRRGIDAAAREAALATLRFFDTSAADHQRDEDDDLFPLLRRRAGELERAEISAVINELEADHATMARQWAQLRELLEAIAAGQAAPLAAADVDGFAWLYRRHLEKESAIVLPFAREVLRPRECAAFGERMAARRVQRV